MLSILGILLKLSITYYAIVAVMCFLTFQVLSGVAVFLLPKRLPDTFAASPIKLKPFARVFFSLGLVLISAIFFILAAMDKLSTAPVFLGAFLLSAIYYWLRSKWLNNRALNADEMLKR